MRVYGGHRNTPTFAFESRALLESCLDLRRRTIVHALAVAWHDGIEVHEARNPLGNTVGDRGDDNATIAVPDEDDARQILDLEHFKNVAYMRLEADLG